MNILSLAYKYHSDWLNIAKSIVKNDFAEDIVQEFYIKLDRYAKYEMFIFADGSVNKTYAYMILRSICLNYLKEKNKFCKVDLHDGYSIEENDIEAKEAIEKIYNKIDNELKNWHWYDKDLFKIYKDENISIRKLAKETTISSSSIFHTLKSCKEKIKDKFSEDYQDYLNQDYERI